MICNKNKTRSWLADTSVANIIHTKDLEPVLADAKKALHQEMRLNTERALVHNQVNAFTWFYVYLFLTRLHSVIDCCEM